MDDDGLAVNVGFAGAIKAHGVIENLGVKFALVIDLLVHHVARMRAVGKFVAVGFVGWVEMAASGFKASFRIAFPVFMDMKRHPLSGRKVAKLDLQDRGIRHAIDRQRPDFLAVCIDKA